MTNTISQYSHTVGFALPTGFDVASYDGVNEHVAVIANPNDSAAPWKRNAWFGYAGAWNGLAFRLRATSEHNAAFATLITHGTSPRSEERYAQERELFCCIASALSAVECFYMAAYCVANVFARKHFPLEKEDHLNKTPKDVLKIYQAWLPSDSLSHALANVTKSKEFAALSDFRNSLAHRGVLPRQHFLSTVADTPSAIPANPKGLAEDFRYTAHLGQATTALHTQWVIGACSLLVGEFHSFLATRARVGTVSEA